MNTNRLMDELIGLRYGEQKQIEVLSDTGEVNKDKRKIYDVKCHLCANDSQLFGAAIFQTTAKAIQSGHSPCGCAQNYRWSATQYKTRINRAYEGKHIELINIAINPSNTGRVKLKCLKHNTIWEPIISSALRGHGCGICKGEKISSALMFNDSKMTETFMKYGVFKQGTIFERIGTSQHWKMTCPACPGDFISNQYNLANGKIPCNCAEYGFKNSLPASLYVIKACSLSHDFTGYGISNNVDARIKNHRKELLKNGFVLDDLEVFHTSGVIARLVEKKIKSAFTVFAQNTTGFRTEATYAHFYGDVVAFVDEQINSLEVLEDQETTAF